MGTLMMEYVNAGGDASFMYTPSPEMETQGTSEVQTITPEAADAQLNQEVAESIQSNVQANPEGVQTALTEGMTALTKVESRIKADNGNINYQGINIEASHNAYIDYASGKGSVEVAATAMAGDIRVAVMSGGLTASEVNQLQNVLADIVSSAELAAAYIGIDLHDIGARTINNGMMAMDIGIALNDGNSDITEHQVDNSVENPTTIDYNLVKKYVYDIEERTGVKLHQKQIEELKKALRNKEYKKLFPRELSQHRSRFNDIRDSLVAQWEENTGQKWPVYESDVISVKTGKVSRKAGSEYDAHHIIECSWGGDNEWWNIHPARYPDVHQAGIHGAGSPANKLF